MTEHHASLPATEVPLPVCYNTPLGSLTFEELHNRSRKYAACVLRRTFDVNEADIDDGLQAGFLRLWHRLKENPNLLEDKSLAWIGRGLIYTALHATRRDVTFRQRTKPNGEQALEKTGETFQPFRPHSRESRNIDMRIDIHQAIASVAERILTTKTRRCSEYDLWALYGLTMLHVSATETSRLFGVREHSMQVAYKRVRGYLQEALPNYSPLCKTKAATHKGGKKLPREDVQAIKNANATVADAVYEAVKIQIRQTNADTRKQDEIALDGIRRGIQLHTQARKYGLPGYIMQRAYERVHLMIGAQRDPNVRVRRPEHRVKFVFTLTAETTTAVQQLAVNLLQQPKSYEKLVALHAHISNLAISTTAKHFNIPTSTLRYYAQQIGTQLGTPTRPAREASLAIEDSLYPIFLMPIVSC